MAKFTLSQLDATPLDYNITDTDLMLITAGTATPFLSSMKVSALQLQNYFTTVDSGWTDSGTVVRLSTSTDKVGIGTTDPGFPLTVASETQTTLVHLSAKTQDVCGLRFETDTKAWELFNSNGVDNQGFGIYDRNQAAYRLAIDGSTGNVGIGTTAPSEVLTVAGNVSASGSVYDIHTANVKEFGAVGDGATDDGAAIQLALDSGRNNIYIPAGTYKFTQQLVVPDNVNIFGDGTATTILSCVATSEVMPAILLRGTGVTPGSTLPTLSEPISAGQWKLEFSSAPGLSSKELFFVHNPIGGAAGSASGYSTSRSSEHAGEFMECLSAVGNTVYLTGPAYGDYNVAQIGLSAVATTTHVLKNFTLEGPFESAHTGIEVDWNRDTLIENVNVSNASVQNLYVRRCYNTRVQGGEYTMLNPASASPAENAIYPGNQYGIDVNSSQHITIDGVLASSDRHGISVGGGGDNSIPSRDVKVVNSTIKTSRGWPFPQFAADLHANTEFCCYRNCLIDGGIAFGGNNNVVSNNIIRSSGNGLTVYVSEPVGANLRITNNHIIKEGPTGQGDGPIPWDASAGVLISITLEAETYRKGTIVVDGNYMEWALPIGTSDLYPILINRYACNEQQTSLVFKNNVVKLVDNITTKYCYVSLGTGANYPHWERVEFSNNVFNGTGVYIRGATKCIFNNNEMNWGWWGLYANYIDKHFTAHNNTIIGMRSFALDVTGTDEVGGTNPLNCVMSINGNHFVDNISTTVWPNNTTMAVTSALSASVLNNAVGSPNSSFQSYPMRFFQSQHLQRGTNQVYGTGSVTVSDVTTDSGIGNLV